MPTLLTAEAVAALRALLAAIGDNVSAWTDLAAHMECEGVADPEAALALLSRAVEG